MKRAKILVVHTGKGGDGKTTTTGNLAAEFAEAGYSVLMIDTDHRADLTSTYYPGGIATGKTIHDLFRGTKIENVIFESVIKNVDIIPACAAFSTIETEINSKLLGELILKKALKSVLSNYDIIIIDTPPNIGIIQANALCAGDEVLVPVHQKYSIKALKQVIEMVMLIQQQEELNPNLIIGGILLVKYKNNTKLAKSIRRFVEEKCGTAVYNTVIPDNVSIADCVDLQEPVRVYAPESKGAIAYHKLSEEILTKWGML